MDTQEKNELFTFPEGAQKVVDCMKEASEDPQERMELFCQFISMAVVY